MYAIIRILIGCIFLGCSFVIVRRSGAVHKRVLYIVFAVISLTLAMALMFLPFENIYLTFDSPDKAYEYYHFESDIKLVVDGENSDFIIDNKNDSYSYLIIPKTSEGWKVGIGSDTKRVVQNIFNGIVVYVYQYKNTNDYFVTVLDSYGGVCEISDSCGSTFYSLERVSEPLGKSFVTYYGHISEFDSQYWISVDGNKIFPFGTADTSQ